MVKTDRLMMIRSIVDRFRKTDTATNDHGKTQDTNLKIIDVQIQLCDLKDKLESI